MLSLLARHIRFAKSHSVTLDKSLLDLSLFNKNLFGEVLGGTHWTITHSRPAPDEPPDRQTLDDDRHLLRTVADMSNSIHGWPTFLSEITLASRRMPWGYLVLATPVPQKFTFQSKEFERLPVRLWDQQSSSVRDWLRFMPSLSLAVERKSLGERSRSLKDTSSMVKYLLDVMTGEATGFGIGWHKTQGAYPSELPWVFGFDSYLCAVFQLQLSTERHRTIACHFSGEPTPIVRTLNGGLLAGAMRDIAYPRSRYFARGVGKTLQRPRHEEKWIQELMRPWFG